MQRVLLLKNVIYHHFELGFGDHTKRLQDLIRNIYLGYGMYIDNLMSQFSLLEAKHAAQKIADLIEKDVQGVINVSDSGPLVMSDIIHRIEIMLSKQAIYKADGKPSGYNGYYTNTFDITRMQKLSIKSYDTQEYIDQFLEQYVNRMISGGLGNEG